jgi:hypothetical protein
MIPIKIQVERWFVVGLGPLPTAESENHVVGASRSLARTESDSLPLQLHSRVQSPTSKARTARSGVTHETIATIQSRRFKRFMSNSFSHSASETSRCRRNLSDSGSNIGFHNRILLPVPAEVFNEFVNVLKTGKGRFSSLADS